MPKSATVDQVKDQFRKLALKYHPDVKPDSYQGIDMQKVRDMKRDFYDRFLLIKEAYDCLQNSETKQRYDEYIQNTQQRRETIDMKREMEIERIRYEIYRKAEIEKQNRV